MKRIGLAAFSAAVLTAVALAATGSATLDPGATTYYRGWAIQGTQPYFQLWNPGPEKLCVHSMSVNTSTNVGAVWMVMTEPLPTSIVDFGAAVPNGIDLSANRSRRGELRASVGSERYGGQIWSFTLKAGETHTFKVGDCLGAQRGLGIRLVPYPPDAHFHARVGARWEE